MKCSTGLCVKSEYVHTRFTILNWNSELPFKFSGFFQKHAWMWLGGAKLLRGVNVHVHGDLQ